MGSACDTWLLLNERIDQTNNRRDTHTVQRLTFLLQNTSRLNTTNGIQTAADIAQLLYFLMFHWHKIGDMGRVRTHNLWGVSRTRYRLRHTTPRVKGGLCGCLFWAVVILSTQGDKSGALSAQLEEMQ
ncbi:hypothetical protein Bbelb_106180 [Branchiostoma belcheri]|nr:hypothetical protein Bbelb_106180 [Branchiostoma belcheri]